MPKNDEEEKRTKNGGGGKNQNSNGKSSAAAAEECDFIDEKELRGALQLAVLKTADSVAQEVGARNGMDMKVEVDVVNRVSALVWETLSDSWAEDLARFAGHANRQRIQVDDVALLTRRNPQLFEAACALAGIEAPENGGQKKKGTRKRKKDENPTFLQTPKADAKKSKNFITSTPKIPEKSTSRPVFGNPGISDITPIRPNYQNEDDDIIIDDYVPSDKGKEHLSVIQEEANDSFDAINFQPRFSMTNPNMSSLLRQAENHQDEEAERLEAMIPEEQVENGNDTQNSIDAFFGGSGIPDRILKAPESSSKNLTKSDISMDPFLSTIMEKPAGKPEEKRKSGVFNKKISAFDFDSDDSFDEPGPSKAPPKKETPVSKKSKTESQSTPKIAPKSTPKSVVPKVTPKSTKTNKSPFSAARDSFDEFDFDI